MCWAEPTDQDMDLKVTISMIELSQILKAAVISSFQERHILTSIKILSTSPDTTNDPSSREKQKYFLCETAKEDDTLETTFNGEWPEIEEFSTYISMDPSCSQAIEHLHGLRKEGKYQDFIDY